MPAIKKFHDSIHARLRSGQREIPLQAMKDVVNYPDAKRQQYRGEHGGFVYKFTKVVDGDTLAVIAEVKKDECWLISAFWPT